MSVTYEGVDIPVRQCSQSFKKGLCTESFRFYWDLSLSDFFVRKAGGCTQAWFVASWNILQREFSMDKVAKVL